MRPVAAFILVSMLAPAAFPAGEPPPTVITSQQLDMQSSDTDSVFHFTGLVTVTGNEIELTCDDLEITVLRPEKGTQENKTSEAAKDAFGEFGSFERLIAKGRVKIVQGDRVATCGRAEVLSGEDKIILTENPLVRDGDSAVTGDRMILFRGERRAVVESGPGGPARVTLPPMRDLGFSKEGETKSKAPAADVPSKSP